MKKIPSVLSEFNWFGFFTVGTPTIFSFLNFFQVTHIPWLLVWSPFLSMLVILALMLIFLPVLEWSTNRSIKKTEKYIERIISLKKEKKKRERVEKLEKLNSKLG